MMKGIYDSIVVGAGILGIAHAYFLNQMGHRVALIEKDNQPTSASVRNFGQIVPSGFGQKWQNYGRESLKVYNDIQSQMDIGIRREGTLYLAENAEEVQLIEELAEINRGQGYYSEVLTSQKCEERLPALRKGKVLAGLFFPQELNVDAPFAIRQLIKYLVKKGVDYFPGTSVSSITEEGKGQVLACAEGKRFSASNAFICSGSDCQILFPDLLAAAPIQIVKLQLQLTSPQGGQKFTGSILTGSSIRRYESFKDCPSYPSIMNEGTFRPFFDQHSIHILLKQRRDGRVIIGDSHHYAPIHEPEKLGFEVRHDINQRIFEEVRTLFDLRVPSIEQSWLGYYTQTIGGDVFQESITDNIFLLTGVGGKGMTASFGLARQHIESTLRQTTAT
jgi:FAD dependent oxidoreductase TIGR03364